MFPFLSQSISISDLKFILQLLLILCGIIVAVCVIIAAIAKHRRNQLPVQYARVRVLEKQPSPLAGVESILFETESGSRMRLTVAANNRIVAGDEGNLTWRGHAIDNFERIQ